MLWKAYMAALVSFLVIDAAWIKLVASKLYQRDAADLLAASPRLGAAGAFYLFYVAGVVFVAVRPAIANPSLGTAALYGAVLGAMAYGTFTVTNYSVLRQWSVALIATDIAWGAFLSALSAECGYLAQTRL